MARPVNDDTLKLIKQWEGLRLEAYRDPGSRDGAPWTIGYGHTSDDYRRVYKGQKITEAEADDLLLHDIAEAADLVDSHVRVALTENQRGALVAFALNVGPGSKKVVGFTTSTLLKKLNAGQYNAVPGELAKWKYNDGKVMDGLINRRAAEAGLWAKGAFVASSPVAAAPERPPVFTKENVSWGAGIGTTLLGSLSGTFVGSGPVQIALAVVIIAAFAAGAWFFISKRVAPK